MKPKNLSHSFPGKLGRLIMLASILLLNIGTPLPATQAAGNTPGYSVFLPVAFSGSAKDPGETPPPPTAQQLIQDDLAAGKIDADTALLYRAYALYGDSRLPDKYGGGFLVEDMEFFQLAQDPNLSAEMKARLEPFVVRPDDPKSIYNITPAGNAPQASEPTSVYFCDTDNWTARRSSNESIPIKVHSTCTGDYQEDITNTLQMMESLWEPMTGLMGEPIPDKGGAEAGYSTDIDVYLLNPGDELKRWKGKGEPLDGASGVAPVAPPASEGKASGYMIIDRQQADTSDLFKQTLAHEFFHVLEHSHNYLIHFHPEHEEWWLTEASATWAEAHFVPSNSKATHTNFTYYFQQATRSLNASARTNSKESYYLYAAYIWPFFIEQQIGDSAIGRIWDNLEGVGDNWQTGDQVVNIVLPFSYYFPDFALRNLNVSLTPGDPIYPRYIDFDPQFPDNRLPGKLEGTSHDFRDLGPTSPSLYLGREVPSLDAEYYHFALTEKVLTVKLDLSEVVGLSGVEVDAVVKKRGKPWELQSLNGLMSVKLCDIEELYLVFSNKDLFATKPAAVSFTLSALATAEECTCPGLDDAKSWDGKVSITYSIYAENSRKQVTKKVETAIDTHLAEISRDSGGIGYWTENMGGNGLFFYRNLWLAPTGNYLFSQITGNGTPTPYDAETSFGSRMALTFYRDTCSYNFYLSVWIMGTFESDSSPTVVKNVGIANAGSALRPVPFGAKAGVITGSGAFPAINSEEVLGTIDYFSQDDYDIYSILGWENMGEAQVSWTFTPSTLP